MNILNKRKMMTNLLVYAFVIAVAMPVLSAESRPLRGPIPFHLYDMNGDGFISPDEFQTIRSQRMVDKAAQGYPMRNAATQPKFSQFDTNTDGHLTPDELIQGQQLQQQKRWAMRQNRGMGKSGQNRPMNCGNRMPDFETFDENKDGFISEEELIKGRSMRISQRIQQGYQMRNTANIPSFQSIDTNGDGKISSDEFHGHQQQHQLMRRQMSN